MSDEKGIKYFNLGYELAQRDQKLAKSLFSNINGKKVSSFQYFGAGVKQFEKDSRIGRSSEKNKTIEPN